MKTLTATFLIAVASILSSCATHPPFKPNSPNVATQLRIDGHGNVFLYDPSTNKYYLIKSKQIK